MSEAMTRIGRERDFLRFGDKRACVKSAICYALTSLGEGIEQAEKIWPFSDKFTALDSEEDSLVRAAGLLVAAIEQVLSENKQKGGEE